MPSDKKLYNIKYDPDHMLEETVKEVKQLTGYDRVMLYQFDDEYNGTVVAEAVERDLPAYLHLRYPHTDIPEQARKLYLKQEVRQVVSTEADAYAMLISDDEQSIDISSTDNRAVSPIHLEYLIFCKMGSFCFRESITLGYAPGRCCGRTTQRH